MESSRTKALVLAAALSLPLAGLALLLAVPDLDVHWEHHPSHFWLVLSVAFIDTVLGIAMSEAATRRDDARLFLVSMALLASAGFLALHALATPEAIVKEPNNGFVIATPIGLFLAAGFAAASAMQPEHGPGTLSRSTMRWLRWALIAVLVAWASASLTGVSLLRGPAPSEAPTLLRILAPVAIGLYVFAAARYLSVYARRRRPLPLAVATAFILLAEAVLTIIVARSWHASWWEWHGLMAVAFLIVLLTARAEYRHEGSITAAFGGLYMERTLERIDRRQADSLSVMVSAIRTGEPLAPDRTAPPRRGDERRGGGVPRARGPRARPRRQPLRLLRRPAAGGAPARGARVRRAGGPGGRRHRAVRGSGRIHDVQRGEGRIGRDRDAQSILGGCRPGGRRGGRRRDRAVRRRRRHGGVQRAR